MAVPASSRIRFGVDCLYLKPDDRVLEIGCGHGVALSLIGEQLGTGLADGIDRSGKMVTAATTRNRELIEAGRVRVERGVFPEIDPAGVPFSILLAIHVPLFRDDPDGARDAIHRLILPGGQVVLVGQPLQDRLVDPWIAETRSAFEVAGLKLPTVILSPDLPRTVCVAARIPDQGIGQAADLATRPTR